MPDDAFPIPTRALIEHQDFVRSLAWSLVRDTHDADDVAQDTWLAFLKRPPQARGSLRGWFSTVARNNARNAAREESRRVRRKQAASHAEADDSELELRQRIALQQLVVEAVIGLRDPYRSVILLAYYEGLSAAAIARRRNIPAGTVRAQISRALQMLREKLDREQDGGRATWSVGLIACLDHGRHATHAVSPMLMVAAGVLVAASIGVRAWIVSKPAHAPVPVSLAGTATTSLPAAPSTPLQSVDDASNRRAAVAPTPGLGTSSLDGASLADLLRTGQQIQRLLRERLLTPDPALLSARPDLANARDVKFNRIWWRGALGSEENNLVALRGAGSYLSFATGRQDFEQHPDIWLSGRRFESGFNGCGVIVLASTMRLSDLGPTGPAGIDAQVWSTLNEPSGTDERSIPAQFTARLRSLHQQNGPAIADGQLYLVRSVGRGEHDVLAAFEVLAHDEKSVTIAWRVLKRFEVPITRNVNDRQAVLPAPTPDLIALSTEDVISLHKRIVERATDLILTVRAPIDPAFARYAFQMDGGLARIAELRRFGAILDIEGSGAFWSFTQRSNDYQKDAQLCLEQGSFTSVIAGDEAGFLVGLGAVPLEAITSAGEIAGLDAAQWKRVEFVRDLVPVPHDSSSGLEVSELDRARGNEMQLHSSAAKLGDSYLLRCVQMGKQDVLVAFQVVAKDEAALTLAWKILRQSPASR